MMDDKEHQWHDFPKIPGITWLPWLFWAVVILTVIWATRALAVGARSPQECALIADYGLTVRALTVSGIPLDKRLEILGEMYEFDDHAKELAKIVRQASDKSDKTAQEFARIVVMTCMKGQGDIGGLLGLAL